MTRQISKLGKNKTEGNLLFDRVYVIIEHDSFLLVLVRLVKIKTLVNFF